jgi:hypothetical protein
VTVDEHLDKAFASLDDLSKRELEATADALTSRRHPLHDFASVFSDVAAAREGGWSANLHRYHVRQAVDRADDDLLGRIAEAEAPFWGHVHDAMRASREEAG